MQIKSTQSPQAKLQAEIYRINFNVIQKYFPFITNIVTSIQYAIQARYNVQCKFWTYLKIKGPMFLVQDKYNRYQLIIMNQCDIENSNIKLPKGTKFDLKKVENGYLLCYLKQYLKQDSQIGLIVQGIWTTDQKIEQIYSILKGLQNQQ